jgi:hypothetical protein
VLLEREAVVTTNKQVDYVEECNTKSLHVSFKFVQSNCSHSYGEQRPPRREDERNQSRSNDAYQPTRRTTHLANSNRRRGIERSRRGLTTFHISAKGSSVVFLVLIASTSNSVHRHRLRLDAEC